MRFVATSFLLLLAAVGPAGALQAQVEATAVAPALPLAGGAGTLAPVVDPTWRLQLATEALRLGFAPEAASRAEAVLADGALATALRQEAERLLVLARIAAGDLDGARRAFERWTGPRDAGWALRRALLAALEGVVPAVEEAMAGLQPEALAPGEQPWFFYLDGIVKEGRNSFVEAQAAYGRARDSATTAGQRALFELRALRSRVAAGELNDSVLGQLRQQARDYAGRQVGWQAAQQLAAALVQLGRSREAADVLDGQLPVLPPDDPSAADRCRILLGLIDGVESVRGRAAFAKVLSDGSVLDWQRVALQQLAAAPGERAAYRALLDRLIARSEPHPLLAELRLFRAIEYAGEGAYYEADQSLQRLLADQPASNWRREALLFRSWFAWRQGRFLTAAGLLAELRGETLVPAERARITLLQADSQFSAGDYANAADSYAAAWREPIEGVDRGLLLFQRVVAEIGSKDLPGAGAALDAGAGDAGVSVAQRWRAEWNYLKALQAAGDTATAVLRLERELSPEMAGRLPPELRLRFQWMRAELALATGKPAEAIVLADGLAEFAGKLPDTVAEATERQKVVSAAKLLSAEAQLAASRAEQGLAGLAELRERFPESEAAQQSYLIESRQRAEAGDAAGAEAALIRLVDTYPNSAYTVQALYEAALLAERRGTESDLDQAIKRLERLARQPGAGPLLFHARLMQGDLLRRLDRFEAAQQVYESLRDDPRFAAHPHRHDAEVALADTLLAQRGTSDGGFATATGLLERVFDLAEVPADLRIEAASKLSAALVARDRTARAEETFLAAWTRFGKTPEQLGPGGRYWLGRLLLTWSEWLERRGRTEEARELYGRLAGTDLPGRQVAAARLRRFQTAVPEAVPAPSPAPTNP